MIPVYSLPAAAAKDEQLIGRRFAGWRVLGKMLASDMTKWYNYLVTGQLGLKFNFKPSLLLCNEEPKTREGGDFVRKYEVIFIVKPMEEDATNAVIEKFSNLIADNGGTIDKEDRWGKRKLAYEIQDCQDGYYCLFYVTCEPACVAEVDRLMKINDGLLKHMIVRSDEQE